MGSGSSKSESKYLTYKDDELIEKTIECPICFEDFDENLEHMILPCKHIFCLKCLQEYNLKFFSRNEKTNCPLCRKELSKDTLKEIYSDWKLTKYDPEYWNQLNAIKLKNNINIKKFSILNLKNFPIGYNLIIPYYEHNNFNKPLFFHSSNLIILNPVLSNSLDNIFCLSLDGILDLSDNDCYCWYNYLKKNFIKNKDFNNKEKFKYIFKTYEYSRIKIRFCVKDINSVITYDTRNKVFKYGLELVERNCKVLFRTYLYEKPDDTILINELYSVCY